MVGAASFMPSGLSVQPVVVMTGDGQFSRVNPMTLLSERPRLLAASPGKHDPGEQESTDALDHGSNAEGQSIPEGNTAQAAFPGSNRVIAGRWGSGRMPKGNYRPHCGGT